MSYASRIIDAELAKARMKHFKKLGDYKAWQWAKVDYLLNLALSVHQRPKNKNKETK